MEIEHPCASIAQDGHAWVTLAPRVMT
jgi:hypothetical protein